MQDSSVRRYAHDATHSAVLNLLSRLLPPQGLILDAGCGEGALALSFAQKGYTVFGLDLDLERLKKAPVPVVCGDLEQPLPFPDATFHAVLLVETLEHCLNPFGVLCQLRRVIKPGGLLILTAPNPLELASRLRFLLSGWTNLYSKKRMFADHRKRHLFMLPAPLLRRLLEEAGFEVVSITVDRWRRSSLALLPFLFPALLTAPLDILLGRTLILLAQRRG